MHVWECYVEGIDAGRVDCGLGKVRTIVLGRFGLTDRVLKERYMQVASPGMLSLLVSALIASSSQNDAVERGALLCHPGIDMESMVFRV